MYIFLMGGYVFLTPCKVEEPLQGMELQEKEGGKDEMPTEKQFRKNPKIKGAY